MQEDLWKKNDFDDATYDYYSVHDLVTHWTGWKMILNSLTKTNKNQWSSIFRWSLIAWVFRTNWQHWFCFPHAFVALFSPLNFLQTQTSVHEMSWRFMSMTPILKVGKCTAKKSVDAFTWTKKWISLHEAVAIKGFIYCWYRAVQ